MDLPKVLILDRDSKANAVEEMAVQGLIARASADRFRKLADEESYEALAERFRGWASSQDLRAAGADRLKAQFDSNSMSAFNACAILARKLAVHHPDEWAQIMSLITGDCSRQLCGEQVSSPDEWSAGEPIDLAHVLCHDHLLEVLEDDAAERSRAAAKECAA